MRSAPILTLILLAGCSRPEPAAAPVAPASAAPATAAAPAVHRFTSGMMGTTWAIQVARAPQAEAKAAASAAFREVERLERVLSEWRPSSDLGRLNTASMNDWVLLEPESYALIKQGVALGEASGGAFDISWAALRGLWDFKAKPPSLPKKSALDAAVALVDYRKLSVDPDGHRVMKRQQGMAVGLGGIAKGYAIDRAAALLKDRGLEHFIIDGGGDLYVAGEKAPGTPWTVGVQHPRADRVLVALPAKDQAVVSSGDYERFFELGGRRYHHILDPKTGLPARASVAVTVRAPDATRADALATALFVLGPVEGIKLADAQGVDAAILAPDGTVATTHGLAGRFPARWKD